MNLEDHILIENYLKGNLSKEELKIFLKKLESDADFKREFDFEKKLFESLNDDLWSSTIHKGKDFEDYKKILGSTEIKKLKSTIEKVNNQYINSRKKITRWIFYASAAVIALLITSTLFNQKPSMQELYLTYIERQELPSFTTRSDSTNAELIKAEQLFDERQYEEALIIFQNEIDMAEGKNAVLYIYAGIAQMELNKYEKAEKTFNQLISSNLIDAEKGMWYKALLYIKMKKLEKAELILKEIIEKKLFNSDKAKELLKEIS